MWRRSASGARINDLHAYLCAFRSKPPVSANRVTQTRSPSPPLPRKRIPEKRFENFQSSERRAEPSRAEPRARVTSATYFFFSLSTFHPPIFPRCPEWRIHPFRWHTRAYTVSISVYIYIYIRARETGRSTGALPFFQREGGRGRISAKAGSNGRW